MQRANRRARALERQSEAVRVVPLPRAAPAARHPDDLDRAARVADAGIARSRRAAQPRKHPLERAQDGGADHGADRARLAAERGGTRRPCAWSSPPSCATRSRTSQPQLDEIGAKMRVGDVARRARRCAPALPAVPEPDRERDQVPPVGRPERDRSISAARGARDLRRRQRPRLRARGRAAHLRAHASGSTRATPTARGSASHCARRS